MKHGLVVGLLLWAVAGACQELPDAPSAFLKDKPQVVAMSYGIATHAIDTIYTVRHIGKNGCRESFIPSQNKAVVAATIMGSEALITFVQYKLWKHGHKKIAALLQYTVGSANLGAFVSSGHNCGWTP